MKGALASPELPASPRSGAPSPWQGLVEKEAPVSENAKHVSKSLKWAHRALWLDVTLYVFFLVAFILSALVPFNSIAWDGFQIVNTFTKFAAAVEWPDPSNTFDDIHSVVDFWSWWEGPFKDIALGFNNYAGDDDATRVRRDHRPGHILDLAVVGTVRLRQQRAIRYCENKNRLEVHPADTLCYLNDGTGSRQSRDDWAWPAFAVPLPPGAAEPPLAADTSQSVAGKRGAQLAGERAAGAPPEGAPDAPIVAQAAGDAAAPAADGAAPVAPADDIPGGDAEAPVADGVASVAPVPAADVEPADEVAAETPLSGDVMADPPVVEEAGAATPAVGAGAETPAAAQGSAVVDAPADDTAATTDGTPAATDGTTAAADGTPAASDGTTAAADGAETAAEDTAATAPAGVPPALGLRWGGGRRGFSEPQGVPPGGLPLAQLRRHLLQAPLSAPAAAPADALAAEAAATEYYDRIRTDAEPWTGVPPPPGADGTCLFMERLSYWGGVGAAVNRTCENVEARKAELLAQTPAFLYRNHSALSGAEYLSTSALRVYNGGGYAHDFDVRDVERFESVTRLLRDSSWLDGATRFVVVEFALFSAPTRLLATAFFMVEVHGSGVATPRLGYEVFGVATYRHSFLGRGRIGVDVAFVVLCSIIFLSDVLSVVRHRSALERRWYSNPFFWMSVIMWCATVAVAVLRIITASRVGRFDPASVAPATDAYGAHWPRLHGIASRLRVERSLIALLSFCVWLRIFKYTRAVPGFGTIGRTIMRAFPAIFTYIAMSAVVFLGFAQSFFLGFYTSNPGFQTLPESLMSMVRFTSGDVDFGSLQRANNTLAPLLYTMALFVLSFVWTSLLLAIVLNAYYLEISAEGSFEFDKVFKDFGLANPLLRRHPDYDEAALTDHHLTPALYNRFVLNTLTRFNPDSMGVMAMSDFLARARLGSALAPPDAGETQPLGGMDRDGGGKAWDAASTAHGQATDSSEIIVRWGALRGVRGPLDIHALYFPRSMDEHRCRAWWVAHKHYLRVGDAVKRNVAAQLKTVRQLKPLKVTYRRVTSVKSRASWASRGKRTRTERASQDAGVPPDAAIAADYHAPFSASAASSVRSTGSAHHAREQDISAASSATMEGVAAPPAQAGDERFRWRSAGAPRPSGSLRRRDTGAGDGT